MKGAGEARGGMYGAGGGMCGAGEGEGRGAWFLEGSARRGDGMYSREGIAEGWKDGGGGIGKSEG